MSPTVLGLKEQIRKAVVAAGGTDRDAETIYRLASKEQAKVRRRRMLPCWLDADTETTLPCHPTCPGLGRRRRLHIRAGISRDELDNLRDESPGIATVIVQTRADAPAYRVRREFYLCGQCWEAVPAEF